MTSLNKQAKNRLKRLDRKFYNIGKKIMKARDRRLALVALGKTLVPGKRTVTVGFKEVEVPRQRKKVLQRVTEVKDVLVLPKTGPKTGRGQVKEPTQFHITYGNSTSLAFISGKTYRHHGAQRKTRPGEKELRIEANVANGIGELARQESKAREPKTPNISIVPLDHALAEPVEVTIGEYADRDPQQGAAIDHSITTGEPLFAEPKQ